MLVFPKKNLVFLSVPKTASTSYINGLQKHAAIVAKGPASVKHMNLQRFDKTLRPLLELNRPHPYETLAIIRHPLDWLSSWYRYRMRDTLDCGERSTAGITFDEFVTEYLKGAPATYANVGSQARFLKPAEGQPKVTHLFQYENQDRIKEFLRERICDDFELGFENVSPKIRVQISPDVEARLRKKCVDQFELWESAGPHKA